MTATSKLVVLSRIELLKKQIKMQEEIVTFHEGKLLDAMAEQNALRDQIEELEASLDAMEVSDASITK